MYEPNMILANIFFRYSTILECKMQHKKKVKKTLVQRIECLLSWMLDIGNSMH